MILQRAAFDFLNHLLSADGWAAARLKPFAGQHARFELGPWAQTFTVAGDGHLSAADPRAPVAVTVRLPDDAPLRWLRDRASVFASARIAGAADFAEALGFVARHLRWDAEADLARVIGDIPARRLAQVGQRLAAAGAEQAQRFGANLGEFIVDEERFVVRSDEARRFGSAVDALRDDLERLTQRVHQLR